MKPTNAALALAVLVSVVVSFWVGVIFARIFPYGDARFLIDLAVAFGTVGAVIVALWQSATARSESGSRAYREAAIKNLETAVNNFLANPLANGSPINTRRHWLNFARGIRVSQQLASCIQSEEQRIIWRSQEHVWRERVYDVLQPIGQSYPLAYYREPALSPGADGLPLAEQSLLAVYAWASWPSDLPDPLDGKARFSEEERENMRTFGPIGLAEFIDVLRPPVSEHTEQTIDD